MVVVQVVDAVLVVAHLLDAVVVLRPGCLLVPLLGGGLAVQHDAALHRLAFFVVAVVLVPPFDARSLVGVPHPNLEDMNPLSYPSAVSLNLRYGFFHQETRHQPLPIL